MVPQRLGKSIILDNIQYMRGIAALLVVFSHILDERYSALGALGVGIFFVISGFIMTVTAWDSFATVDAPREFLLRRIQRVFPLYWIALSIKIFIDSRQKDFVWTTGSYFLLPVVSPNGLVEPVHGVGWSLVWEMMFYYIFALSLSLQRRSGLVLILSALVALTFAGYLTTFRSVAWHGSSIFLLFALGILIGIVTQVSAIDRSRHGLLGGGLALTALVIGIAIVVFQIREGWFEFLELVLSGAIILAAAIAPNISPSSWVLKTMHLIGDASYSLYLTHTLTFSLGRSILKRAHLLSLEASLWPVMIVAACVVGVLVHMVVEKRIIAYFRVRTSRGRAIAAKAEVS